MQVASRWAEPVVSDLVSVPYDGNHHTQQQQIPIPAKRSSSVPSIQQQQQQPSPTILITPNIFPPQRVEPVDMSRQQQQQQQTINRNKIGYSRSATTDEQQGTNTYMQQSIPIKRVKHPTDQSSFILFLKRLSKFCFSLFISIPCVLFITLMLPISWLIRIFIRFTCRYHCTVTPCTCSYLSASDLFWLYNSKKTINRNKTDETTKLNSRIIAPIAAAIFFLEGNFFFLLHLLTLFVFLSRSRNC